MFGISTNEEMPEAFRTDPEAWDVYVGSVWAQMLTLSGMQPSDAVFEIAPGSSAKIGHALMAVGFNGTLDCIEASAEALAALEQKYAALLPQAKGIRYHPIKLCDTDPSFRCDILVGSHIIDDFLLGEAQALMPDENIFEWATRYNNDLSPVIVQAWQKIKEYPGRLSAAKNRVTEDILNAITLFRPRVTILSQYPSSTLADHALDDLNRHACDILMSLRRKLGDSIMPQNGIQAGLNRNKNYGNAHIGEHVLNAEYWMICRHNRP